MKRFSLILTLLLLMSNMVSAGSFRQNIDSGWKFRQARLYNWYPAAVPGVVHTDLMANRMIEDPYYRLNERGVQWIDKEDWIYQTVIEVEPELMRQTHIRLVCEGLDTYADVYLNGTKIIAADNMFREWKADVKPLLKGKNDTLKVYFHSPIKMDMPKWEALPYQLEAGNDQSENGGLFDRRVSVFARKAGYHYGWDWGPRLVTSGIWKPVYLEGWSGIKIENIFFRQPEVSSKRARLCNEVTVLADRAGEAEVAVTDEATGKVWTRRAVNLEKGENRVSLPFEIRNPKLWWTNGLGDPHLYRFTTTVRAAEKAEDAKSLKVGVRSLKIIHKPDRCGHSFYVELNGVPLFSKGANYIPQDNFLPRVTDRKYEETVLAAVNANMNMLRVWGGGIYEKDIFYDLCDKYGILVWQDFMFACSLYPAEGKLLENIRQEAIENVKRLRNHACIALWCGNNECQDAWFNWGWKRKYEKMNPEYAAKIWKEFKDLYFVTLPEVVKEYDPDSFYWPSSPFAGYDHGSNDRDGDRHYWEVWHGKKPVSEYNRVRSRFFSEYGFQSFPEFCSVKKYAPEPRDWSIGSEVMMAHQRGGAHANELIETYLENEYRKPRSFEDFLYMNQVLQGDAIKTAMEAHRRDKPYCMGTLFWQHNDCWPVASWSSRDYYGRWKAQHFFAKKAYRDMLVSPVLKGRDTLDVFVVSDRMKPFYGELKLTIETFGGEVLYELSRKRRVGPNCSLCLVQVPLNKVLNNRKRSDLLVHVELQERGGKASAYANNLFFERQGNLEYPDVKVNYTLEECEEGCRMTLQSDKFARAVYVSDDDGELTCSDNWFDLLPGEKKSIILHTGRSIDELKRILKIKTMNGCF